MRLFKPAFPVPGLKRGGTRALSVQKAHERDESLRRKRELRTRAVRGGRLCTERVRVAGRPFARVGVISSIARRRFRQACLAETGGPPPQR